MNNHCQASISNQSSGIRTFLLISVVTVAVIQFDIFGTVGLFAYGILIAYSALFTILLLRRRKPVLGFALFSSMFFFFWSLATTIINHKFISLASLIQMMIFTCISFFPRNIKEIERDLTTLARIMTVSGIIMAAGTILIPYFVDVAPDIVNRLPAFLSDYLKKSAGDVRVVGPGNNPNTTAGFSLISIIASSYLLSKKEKSRKWTINAITCIALAIPTIFILTASRTSMIACITFALSFSFLLIISNNDGKMLKRKLLLSAIILIALTTVFILVVTFYQELCNYILQRVIRVDSISDGSNRLNLFAVSLSLFLESPIIGASYESFLELTDTASSHNAILEILTFSGIPGFISFIIFSILAFIASIKAFIRFRENNKDFSCMACLLISFLVTHFVYGLTESICINSMKMITVFFYLAIGTSHVILLNCNCDRDGEPNKSCMIGDYAPSKESAN